MRSLLCLGSWKTEDRWIRYLADEVTTVFTICDSTSGRYRAISVAIVWTLWCAESRCSPRFQAEGRKLNALLRMRTVLAHYLFFEFRILPLPKVQGRKQQLNRLSRRADLECLQVSPARIYRHLEVHFRFVDLLVPVCSDQL
ncbi:unnamed protein product [Nesidiocoris tenuis]|uniref:Uncharacterized protein n=1 Tax=Nesidiocoris tenuis TaxID=355587 RepID=A0A6H5HD71_9HEMI|nr:unnamed protein product [Nesidiocoris tenuis]